MQGKEHVPDLTSRAKVVGFVCAGFAQAWIAKYFEIAEDTLVKHYKHELHNSRMDRQEQVAANAYKMAMEGSERMTELICTTQLRWAKAKAPEEIEASKAAAEAQLSLLERLANQQASK